MTLYKTESFNFKGKGVTVCGSKILSTPLSTPHGTALAKKPGINRVKLLKASSQMAYNVAVYMADALKSWNNMFLDFGRSTVCKKMNCAKQGRQVTYAYDCIIYSNRYTQLMLYLFLLVYLCNDKIKRKDLHIFLAFLLTDFHFGDLSPGTCLHS